PGTITFQQSGGTGQSSCAALCTIPATNSGPTCPGRTVNLFTPGFAGATYLWTGPRCFTSTDQNPTNVVVPTLPGTYQYFVTATDAAGNSCSGYTEVTVLAGVSLGRDSVVNSCTGGTADLTNVYNTSGLTAVWTFNTATVGNPAAVTDAGIYQLIATNVNGCSDTALVTVSFAPQQFANDTTIAVCSGTDANLTTVFNTTGYTTSFEFGNTPVPNPAAVNVPGDYNLIVSSAGGCVDTVQITVNFNTVTATAATSNATCTQDGTITVTPGTGGTAPFEYSISTNPGVFQTATVFNAPQGNYTITARDISGCTGTTSATVGFTDDLTLAPIDDETICGSNTVTLTAVSNATTLTWSPATGLSTTTGSTTVASPATATMYTVTAVLGSCTKTEDVTVNLEAGITVNAGSDFSLASGSNATMAATASGNIDTYLWSPSTGLSATNVLNPIVTATGTGGVQTYTLTVTSDEGCVASDQVDVTVIASCLRVRNAFTPNGDGNNDVWRIYDDNSCLKSATVQVFNRYGNKVFESKDYRNTWDGTYKGKPVPDATYYAVIEFFMANGTRQFVRTDLTIVR
ncbi:MAG: gliding motility-associated C-terminal domain-containing protein, partial [Sphingobacteriales bacterium]